MKSFKIGLVFLAMAVLFCGCPKEDSGTRNGGKSDNGIAGKNVSGSSEAGEVNGTVDAGGTAAKSGAGGGGDLDSMTAVKSSSVDSVGATARIPKIHRPAGSSCPRQRGPSLKTSEVGQCEFDPNADIACVKDSDCTADANGRCVAGGGPACQFFCTYDMCFYDSDCPCNQPCECRSSASSNEQNLCMTESNCRVDADCGAGGYCSPSLVRESGGCWDAELCQPDSGSCLGCHCQANCGLGYFCHTPNDACIDDSDCKMGVCAYRIDDNRWRCSIPWRI